MKRILAALICCLVACCCSNQRTTHTRDATQKLPDQPANSKGGISQAPGGSAISTFTETAIATTVPFVGCISQGADGSLPVPTAEGYQVLLPAAIAERLAFYKSEVGPGVLAPRGWYCVGFFGSASATIFVVPNSVSAGNIKSATSVVIAQRWEGDTSGRFETARIIARVFPSYRAFVDRVIGEGLVSADEFPFGPYPADRLTYKGSGIVEYMTHPYEEGLGMASGDLYPADVPTFGVAMLISPTPDLVLIAIRLPPELVDLTRSIIQQAESNRQ